MAENSFDAFRINDLLRNLSVQALRVDEKIEYCRSANPKTLTEALSSTSAQLPTRRSALRGLMNSRV